jgi:hypothetical protein
VGRHEKDKEGDDLYFSTLRMIPLFSKKVKK